MKELYSFSKLDAFKTCPRSFFLSYIKKVDRGNNVYGFLGGEFHECLEMLQKKEITKEEAINKFKESIEVSEMFEMEFPTQRSKESYINCLMEYLSDYERIPIDDFETEEYFEFEVEGVTLRGYIDLYFIKDDNIYVLDYKTSSKFSKKDLVKKEKQLILYGLYLQKKYPDKNITYLGFDMCKYFINKRGTLKERTELEESFGNGYIQVDFNNKKVKELKEYITGIVNEINSLDKNNIEDWERNVKNKFFCDNLCGVKQYCN